MQTQENGLLYFLQHYNESCERFLPWMFRAANEIYNSFETVPYSSELKIIRMVTIYLLQVHTYSQRWPKCKIILKHNFFSFLKLAFIPVLQLIWKASFSPFFYFL
jgi:hypothetical protein